MEYIPRNRLGRVMLIVRCGKEIQTFQHLNLHPGSMNLAILNMGFKVSSFAEHGLDIGCDGVDKGRYVNGRYVGQESRFQGREAVLELKGKTVRARFKEGAHWERWSWLYFTASEWEII
jgi:hypothetical protein